MTEMTMGSLTRFNPDEVTTRGHQRSVDSFFHQRSDYWRDIYQADTLNAFIYRERRSAVLDMVDKLRIPRGSAVLEVGCGAGLTTVALAERGYRVNAVDTVENMLNLAAQAASEAGMEALVETSLADVCQLSFPSQQFELVVAMGVLPWLERPECALLEMFRVTRPGGTLILTVDNNWCLNQMLDPLCFPGLRPLRWKIAETLEKYHLRTPSRPRMRRFSIKQFDGLLSQTGLEKLEGRTLGFGPFTFFKWELFPDSKGINIHRRLQALADRQFRGLQFLGIEYVVMAQKPHSN